MNKKIIKLKKKMYCMKNFNELEKKYNNTFKK